MDARTFPPGVLKGHDSVKGFRLIGSDGPVGKVSWASYAPGESYLVVTAGRLSRKHRVVPAGTVTRVTDSEVHVSLDNGAIRALPELPDPRSEVDEALLNRIMLEAAKHSSTGDG